MRCTAKILSSALVQLGAVDAVLAVEINHAADHPIVLLDEKQIISTGSFHTPHLSLMLDGAAPAPVWVATGDFTSVCERTQGLPPTSTKD